MVVKYGAFHAGCWPKRRAGSSTHDYQPSLQSYRKVPNNRGMAV